MRVIITLACTACKQRNYTSNKNKRNHPDRMGVEEILQILQCSYSSS